MNGHHLHPGIGSRVEGVERIAVLRANALGDLVFALPALDALRAAYPDARITLIGRAWQRELLRDRPSPVDEVVPVVGDETADGPGEAPWLAAGPEARRAWLAAMRARRFDIAIQLHGGGRNSNPLVEALGARVTAGAATEDAPSLDRSIPYVYYQQEAARCLEVVGLVGAAPRGLAPHLAVTDADRAAAAELLDLDLPYAVLHAGASDVRRRWPAPGFAPVGDAIAAAGLRVVLSGRSEEACVTAEVRAAMETRALDLAGMTSLPALVGLLANARIVISNDTGPMHLAIAVGTPTVGIYWIGNLVNGGPLTRALHRPVIAWRVRCPVCGVDCTRTECGHGVSFVDEARVEEVIEAAVTLLSGNRDPLACESQGLPT